MLRVPPSWCDEWLQGNVSQGLGDVMYVGHNRGWYGFVTVIRFFTVIRTPYVDPLLAGFVALHWAEAIFINKQKIVINIPLLGIE